MSKGKASQCGKHAARVIVMVLMVITLVPVTSVFAATYDYTWYIITQGDPDQTGRWANFQVQCTSPDGVKVGEQFEVHVSMKYLIDNKAKFPWIEVLDVSVHTRASPDGANITNSQVDPSRTRITPGEQYAHTFTIAAPRDPGEYLVVMFWQTFSPACSAYGI